MESYMIIANPGENADTSVSISWHTNIDILDSTLHITEKNDLNWNNKKIYKGTFETIDVFNSNYSITPDRVDCYEEVIFNHYHVTLFNLKPNTEYMYKVGEKEFSEIHYFKTGKQEFTFAWVSDFHAYTPIKSRMNIAFDTTKKIIEKENGADFILCGGDAIAWGGSYSFWKEMYSDSLVENYLWVNILGNHDYMSRANLKNTGSYFKEVNYFPRNGYDDQMGICYHFTYGNVLFIILNNEAMGFEEDNEEIKKARTWLINCLKESTSKYIVVCQHYEWFQGITGKSRIWGNLRFKDIFDEYNVDLALGNNNHIYVRTHKVYQDKLSLAEKGTTYIQSPSSDNERGQELEDLSFNTDIIASRFSEGRNTVGVLFVRVTNDFINLKLYNRDIKVIDECFINPIPKVN